MSPGSPQPPPIPWLRRMEARVAAGVTLLVGLSLGTVLVFTTRAVTTRSLERAAQDLETTRIAFHRLLDSRAESAAALTRLITDLPIFRAHLTEPDLAADSASVSEMADKYRRQLRAQFCIVTDARGKWIGRARWPKGVPPALLRSTIGVALAGMSVRDVIAVRRQLFLVVSEPARFADEVLGTMTMAYALDDTVAAELAQATNCQVSVVSGEYVVASSLRGAARTELARLVLDGIGAFTPSNAPVRMRRLGTEQYVEGAFPLLRDRVPGAAADRVVLQVDWSPTQDFLNTLERQFIWAGAVTFAYALVAGVVFSRRMSRPLREIAIAAGEIAAGDWHREVPVTGTAEATTMAEAFNEMSASLRGARERLVHDALHDPLTALPNRTLFMDRLERAMTRRARHPGRSLAVLFVDLDRFKRVNDTIGHPAGDRLLLEIARRLSALLREHDTVSRARSVHPDSAECTLARVGGDEFTILLEDIHDPIDAVRVAERIQAAVAAPLRLDGQEVFTTASIGIAVSTLLSACGEELVRDADIAMYRAKASGGDRCAIFDASMHQRAVERLKLETDLRHALERREFQLVYQPIVSLRDRTVIGFEALLRWQHHERGLVTPAVFLGVAEDTGLITRIDGWALRQACADARQWQHGCDASVSVNISAQSFGQPDIVQRVSATLQETGLDPQYLRLEITESTAMADAERARMVLADLKALGVRISLDDFGTGYSSLSYLQRFPVDTLKIDRSFVSEMDRNDGCREIVRTIMNLARTLGLEVIAEGTETAEQVRDLERLECRFGQGYFFSAPLPLEQLRELQTSRP
jgi:predicted signal transduction protein with EAL and GGDEF domain